VNRGAGRRKIYLIDDYDMFLEAVKENPDFRDQIKEKYMPADQKPDTEIPEKRQAAGLAITERILTETSKSFSQPGQAILKSIRGEHNPARLLALSLSRELSGLRLSEIAQIFQIRSYRTVAAGCCRFKKLLQENTEIKKRHAKIHKFYSHPAKGSDPSRLKQQRVEIVDLIGRLTFKITLGSLKA